MKYIFSILLCLALQTGFSQIYKTVGISYTSGTPTYIPAKAGSWLALDTVTWNYYTYNGSTWISDGYRIQSISGCSAPAYTPTKYQSRLAINACTALQGGPELYYYTGSAWLQINEGQTYTAGAGISITGTEISNTGDLSATNEIQTLSLAGSDLSISGGNTVTLPATGLNSLNGQTGGTQTLAVGTSGTDFAISSSGDTHTFNLPTASASNRGVLSSTDWSAFNSKIGGSGASGQIGVFSSTSTMSGSTALTWDATNVRAKIGTTTPVFIGGISGGGNFPGIWFTTATPSFSNYAILNDGGDLLLNTIAAKSIVFRQNNATWASQTGAVLNLSGGVTATGALGEAAEYVISQGSNKFSYDMSSGDPFIAMSNGTVQVFGAHANSVDGAVFGAFSNHGVTIRAGGNINRVKIDQSGNVAIGTNITPTAKLSVTGSSGYAQFNMATAYSPTSSSDALGSTGDVAWDSNYIYIKTASGWKRAALSTF